LQEVDTVSRQAIDRTALFAGDFLGLRRGGTKRLSRDRDAARSRQLFDAQWLQ
jgi:hypothetical protein